MRVMRVHLTGGELFCRSDVGDIVEAVVRNSMRFVISTNATLVTHEIAELIASTRRCDEVRVSLDGPWPEIHDHFRGAGSFTKAVRGIGLLRCAGLRVVAAITLHHGNVNELQRTVRFALESLGVTRVRIGTVEREGACEAYVRNYCEPMLLTAAERSAGLNEVRRLAEEYGERVDQEVGMPTELHRYSSIANAHSADFGRPGYLEACALMRMFIHVRSDGVYVPCSHLSHIELGRVGQDPLDEIWLKHPELTRLRSRNMIALSSISGCEECRFVERCTGGCAAACWVSSGDDEIPGKSICYREFLSQGGSAAV